MWPSTQSAHIEEIDFSYTYCKRVTQRFLDQCKPIEWRDYSSSNFKNLFSDIKSTDYLLLVTDPNLVITDDCLNKLVDLCQREEKAVVPKYNFSLRQEQLAGLDFEYDTVTTFLELARNIAINNSSASEHAINQPDNGCIILPAQLVASINPTEPIDIFQAVQNNTILCETALVHRFAHYADLPRPELVELVPKNTSSVLDVGCGTGQYGKNLLHHRPEISITGIERSPILAKQAAAYYSKILNGDIDNIQLDKKVDLINCGDILEHLYNPWETLARFADILNNNGHLVVSIPNASHWSIVRELATGNFDYLPAGLFCVGHIRWFTEKSFCEILQQSGFIAEKIIRLQPKPSPQGEELIQTLQGITGYDETSLRTHTLLIRAVKK
jgi:2-polyprenyl-3-methyl-5-hydroxy-6-metoxy-1,4-benzoquinol methylase